MNTEIENLLNSGREKLAREQAEKDEKAAEYKTIQAERQQRAMSALLSLVPAELHEYVYVGYPSEKTINVVIPGAAIVSASVRFEYIWENNIQYVSSADLERDCDETAWQLSFYEAWEGEVCLVPAKNETYVDLDIALARAVDLGDGKAKAEDLAKSQREERAAWKEKNIMDAGDEAPICPLMSQGDEYERCLGVRCAWFVERTNACSLQVLVNNFAVPEDRVDV